MSRRTAFRDQKAIRGAFPMLESPAPIYADDEVRATLAKHAAFGDRVNEWAGERKNRHEQDALRFTPRLGHPCTTVPPMTRQVRGAAKAARFAAIGAIVSAALLTGEGAPTSAAVATHPFRNMPLACGTISSATTYDYYSGNYHGKALDFPVAGGTPVLTPVRGTVRVYTNSPTAGNYVEITDHTTGDVHRLLHLQSKDLKSTLDGKYVARGVMVGRVGTTGLSTGNHLHYEVRDAAGNQKSIEMGGPKLTWNRPTGDRQTTFKLKSTNCRSTAGRWVLTNSLKPDVETGNRIRFSFGGTSYIPDAGDWDGDGVDTAGVFQPSTGRWVLTNSLQPHTDTGDRIRFKFGDKKYLPVVGDWNGDGIDTPGLYYRRNGNWVLTNSLKPDLQTGNRIRFKFGDKKYLPVAGNWNGYRGSKIDTPGLYDPVSGRWVLTNSLKPDVETGSRIRFSFGGRTYLPVAGDWDGSPGDNPGVMNLSTGQWVLTNSLQPDVDRTNRVRFKFGNNGVYTPVAGNWDGWAGDNPGVFAH